MSTVTSAVPSPVPAPHHDRLPPTLRLAVARAGIELKQFFRERDAVVFIFAYPIIMMAIFATVFDTEVQSDGTVAVPFAQYFLPGILATGIMLTSFQTMAIDLAVQRDTGALKRLRGTPLPVTAFFLGKVGQVLVNTGVQVALLLALAFIAYDVPVPDAAGWLTFAWVLVLGTATGTVCGVAFSSVPRTGRSASAVVTPVVLVLQFISGVFFAFFALPSWMQTVASLFPLKWMAQGMRSVFLPDAAKALEPAGSWELGTTAAILGAWLIAGLLVGTRTFRWRRRDDG
ncbi:ABC transporter permease [Actinotalea ferrariae]|uniref:ABC transporter permease n=1 Tax=Actinotalea ferrariae TaxID=1386098 RepID=UPI001C8B3020|nr:ABC transporter permease [Actinotalea ferrariae]MBX9245114.1 ABC transporter permease [Actinotalea ferrariae]